MVIGNGKMLLI